MEETALASGDFLNYTDLEYEDYGYSNISELDCRDHSANNTYIPLYEPTTGVIVLLSVFYGAISLVAVLGNSTVIFIVCTSRRMQSVTNYFIANLALADVIIALFSIPFNFQAALLQTWNHLPDFLCPFSPFFQNLSVNASIFTLTAIAVDRYRAIMYPLKSHSSKYRTKVTIIIMWILSTILAIPMAIAFRSTEIEDGWKQCIPVNIDPQQLVWYRNFLCLVQYFIPCLLIGGAYTRMAITLWSTKTPGAAQLERDIAVMNNKKKVIKMLMLVVALFTLAWLPLQLYDVLGQIVPSINCYQYINMIWFCCHMLAMSNSCYNPFIYLLCNEKFKKELRLKLKCCLGGRENDFNNDYTTVYNKSVWKRNKTFKGGASNYFDDDSSMHQRPSVTALENNMCRKPLVSPTTRNSNQLDPQDSRCNFSNKIENKQETNLNSDPGDQQKDRENGIKPTVSENQREL